MTDMPERAISTAQGLTTAVQELVEKADELANYGHRNRTMIWLLAFAVVLILAAGIVVNAVRASNAADLARQVHDTQVATCQQGNATRLQQIQIWDYVLAVPPAKPPSAQEQKIRADFKAYVHRVFAPRNCSKI